MSHGLTGIWYGGTGRSVSKRPITAQPTVPAVQGFVGGGTYHTTYPLARPGINPDWRTKFQAGLTKQNKHREETIY